MRNGSSSEPDAPLRFQVLRTAFVVDCDTPHVARKLTHLAQAATQPDGVERTVVYAVRNGGLRGYTLFRDGVPCDVEFDATGVLETLSRKIRRDAVSAYPSGVLLGAVTGTFGGARFVIAGETFEERAALSVDLFDRGARIDGNDCLVLSDGDVVAYPRLLRATELGVGSPPTWTITSGRPDFVFVLSVNPGGHGRLTPIVSRDMTRELLVGARPLGSSIEAVRQIAQLADHARCGRLTLGSARDLDGIWPVALEAGIFTRP